MMLGSFVLSKKRGSRMEQLTYPVGMDVRCIADALAAVERGYTVMIEPPIERSLLEQEKDWAKREDRG